MIKSYKNIHNYDVYSLAISKDNSKFISGGGDKNIILTDVIEGKYIRKYTGHTARVNSVAFNQENNVIVREELCRLAPPMTPQFDYGITEVSPIIQSISLRALKTQSRRLRRRAHRLFVRVWTGHSRYLIFVREK